MLYTVRYYAKCSKPVTEGKISHDSLTGGTEIVKLTGTEKGMVVTRGSERGKWGVVVNGYSFSHVYCDLQYLCENNVGV